MFLLRGRGLGDYIDQNDPCTANPSDPICQATAGDTAQDPCTINPSLSFCQQAVVQQGQSLPTPGSNDSQWNQYVDNSSGGTSVWGSAAAAAAAIAAAVTSGNKPGAPPLNPTKPVATPAAASLFGTVPNKWVLGGLAVLGGFLLYRRRNEMQKQRRAA